MRAGQLAAGRQEERGRQDESRRGGGLYRGSARRAAQAECPLCGRQGAYEGSFLWVRWVRGEHTGWVVQGWHGRKPRSAKKWVLCEGRALRVGQQHASPLPARRRCRRVAAAALAAAVPFDRCRILLGCLGVDCEGLAAAAGALGVGINKHKLRPANTRAIQVWRRCDKCCCIWAASAQCSCSSTCAAAPASNDPACKDTRSG